MKHILLVQTGGTIQSCLQSHIIDIKNTKTNEANPLIEAYEASHDTKVSWEVIQPLEILSENMTLPHWNALVSFFGRLDWRQYDGVILAHGSDTLAYTSCLLGLLLGYIDIPLVLIASNYVLEDPRSNGIANFCAAVDFICTDLYKGVFTIYQDTQGRVPVYLATRLLPADCYLDAFTDFGGIPFGYMQKASLLCKYEHDKTNITKADIPTSNITKSGTKKSCASEMAKNVFSHFSEHSNPFTKNILCITPYPGLCYSCLSISPKQDNIAAVLHGLYHSGTLCSAGDANYSFQQFCQKCNDLFLPVYLCSMKEKMGNQYASIATVTEHTQAIPLYNISFPAAYCKLLIAYNQHVYTPQEYMNSNLFYEVLPIPSI